MNLRASIILASLLLAGACAKRASEGATASPAALDAAAASMDGADALADDEGPARDAPDPLEEELTALEDELRAAGVVFRQGARAIESDDDPSKIQAGAGPSENACERRCALAEAICDLEARICDLAGRHPHEARYADLCGRAGRDCETASEACRACSR